MRQALLIFLISLAPPAIQAGVLSRDFGSGYGGVSWGDSLSQLVTLRPGGEHYWSTGVGQRSYSVLDEKPLFGIKRTGERAYYSFDETESVVTASLTFPYDQREKLLGMLVLSFGPVKLTKIQGINMIYIWPRDDGTGLILQTTTHPEYGILTLGIIGPNSALLKDVASNCGTQVVAQKIKK